MPEAHWELFPHGADVGVRGVAATKAAAFEQAALATTAAVTDPELVRPLTLVQVTCEAPDNELLFLDWLNAVVYEMATRRMLFGRFAVQIEDDTLRGEAWGEQVDTARHNPGTEIKGATLTEIKVAKQGRRWVAQCVVDV